MIDYSKYTCFKVEKKEMIATVTLNRPPTNAISKAMHRELSTIWLDLDDDPECNAIILTGAGRFFSVGGDANWMQELINEPVERMKVMQTEKRIIKNLISLRKPIIAAVNGDTMGLGTSVALNCDIIFAVETARIADPHVKVGLVAGDGGCIAWPLNISLCKAKEYLLTGNIIKAPEAERIGLINKALPADKLMEEAWKFAKQLTEGAVWAMSWTKTCLNKIVEHRIDLLYDAMISYEFHSLALPDHKEGSLALLEKRAPKFEGKPIS
jgi:enoyl-CoA hydratase